MPIFSAPPKACSYHRIRREVLELLKALSPYYLLHHSPHSGAGIGLRRCGVWKVFIETNNGHRKMLVLWSEELEWAGEPPHSPSSNFRQGDGDFGNYVLEIPSPCLHFPQLICFWEDSTTWQTWVQIGGCGFGSLVHQRFKKTLPSPMKEYMNCASLIMERMACPRALP